jgi:hypothetical protein
MSTTTETHRWLAGHREAATDRIAAALGGDVGAARRLVSRLSPLQRWVAGDGDLEARAVLGSYVARHGKPRVRLKAQPR